MTELSVSATASAAGLPGSELRVARIRATERLNAPYEVSVLFHTEADVDVCAALGKDFTVELGRGSMVRRFVGVVREVRQAEDLGHLELVRHEVIIVPALRLLSLRRDTRIFQDKTALEILQEVLDEALGPFQRSIDARASATYPKREYCVQYQETDLDFAHRLMEEEGIGYFFDHSGETEVLTLIDDNGQCEKVETVAGDGTIRFRVAEEHAFGGFDPVHHIARAGHTTVTSVAVRDYDFTASEKPEASELSQDSLGRDRESYEHGLGRSLTIGDYSGTAYGANDAARQALLRQQTHLAGGTTMRGTSRTIGLSAGRTFSLLDHPLAGFDGDYLLTSVEHTWGEQGDQAVDEYGNCLECMPLSVPYRPRRRTPKPAIGGPETAIVTGPAGEEIHTDEHGRIKVQFHWDRDGQNDDKATCFMRVRQPLAGTGWGFVFIPRIGMEVIVDFVAGDPDRPVVDGCLYNADNPPPYKLPDEKTKSAIKSQSSPGSPSGFNEIRFEDKAGSEEIFMHAQKDQNEIILHNHTTTILVDQENIVGATQTQKIHGNQTELVIGNVTMTVGTDRTVHVVGAFTETIAQHEKVDIDGGVMETIKPFESRTVTGGLEDKITGGEARLVGSGFEEKITGLHDQHVLGPNTEIMLSGSQQTVTAGPVHFKTPGKHTIKSGGPITYVAPAGMTKRSAKSEEITPDKWKFTPFDKEAKGISNSKRSNSVGFYVLKRGAYVADMSTGTVSIGAGGLHGSKQGLKMSAFWVKVDLVPGKVDKEAAARAAPLEIKVTL